LKFVSSEDTANNIKQPKNIENMLNIICDAKEDFLKDNQNITKIINKLNGHNIHTVNIIPTTTPIDVALEALKTASDKALTEYNKAEDKDKEAKKTAYEDAKAKYEDAVINKFIYKIKEISETIKEDNKDNKDLDFVKLVIVYLNNKKIYNSNASIPGGQLHEAARTYAQSLLNIITNVIPFSNNLFSHFKTGKYDIDNILMGSIPLSSRGNIKDSTETCPIEYSDFDTFKNNHNEKARCYYTNYLFQLKETRTRLKTSLDAILGLSIISTIIFILALFYYIYINYNDDNMRWANMTAIKMQRLSGWNPLNWLNKLFGIIMIQLNKSNY
jgi:hypothetical protein